ncbi:MauE/DoxX family redox-associated membrane protein [Brevibacillus brevis]|nr:MauE/DoxX family redox-associated membrane protein [Brevibacillus brevis]
MIIFIKVGIEWLISIFAAVLYYKSGSNKIKDIYGFVKSMEEYQLMPYGYVRIIGPMVGIIELIIAIWVIIPFTRGSGALLGAIIQAIFLTLMIMNYGKTFVNGCGCFKLNTPQTISMPHVVLNTITLILFIILFIIV